MMASLHDIGMKFGTDKATHHDFCNFYDTCFSILREQPVKLLEIGVYKGASAHMWNEYFPNAELHFIDIDPTLEMNVPKTCHFHVVDCEDEQTLANFDEHSFDIVIDDGGHTMKQQQLAFKHLWPRVLSGGIYVIEDLHTSFGYHRLRCNPDNIAQTTFQMLQYIMCSAGSFTGAITQDMLDTFKQDISHVEIYNPSGNTGRSMTSLIRKNP